MDSIPFAIVIFLCEILSSQAIVWEEKSLSRPVITHTPPANFSGSTPGGC